jgi:hypothetical protein
MQPRNTSFLCLLYHINSLAELFLVF